MNYRGHLLGFVVVFVLLSFLSVFLHLRLSFWDYGIGLMVGLVFSLLPDIDTQASILRRIVQILSFAAILYLVLVAYKSHDTSNLLYVVPICALNIALFRLKHRGVMHQFGTGLLLAVVAGFFLGWFVGVCALVGFCSHLLLDVR